MKNVTLTTELQAQTSTFVSFFKRLHYSTFRSYKREVPVKVCTMFESLQTACVSTVWQHLLHSKATGTGQAISTRVPDVRQMCPVPGVAGPTSQAACHARGEAASPRAAWGWKSQPIPGSGGGETGMLRKGGQASRSKKCGRTQPIPLFNTLLCTRKQPAGEAGSLHYL